MRRSFDPMMVDTSLYYPMANGAPTEEKTENGYKNVFTMSAFLDDWVSMGRRLPASYEMTMGATMRWKVRGIFFMEFESQS